MIDVSTGDQLGILKLLDLLKRVEKYGRTVHWEWLKDVILLPHLTEETTH